MDAELQGQACRRDRSSNPCGSVQSNMPCSARVRRDSLRRLQCGWANSSSMSVTEYDTQLAHQFPLDAVSRMIEKTQREKCSTTCSSALAQSGQSTKAWLYTRLPLVCISGRLGLSNPYVRVKRCC